MTPQQTVNAEIKQHAQETWTPYPGAQSLALAHPAREIFFGGARGPGKSWVQRLWLAKMAVEESKPGTLKYPNYKGAIFRYQSVDLRDWHHEAEKFYCGKLGAKPAGQPREYKFPGGPIIRSGHLADGAYINYVGWEIHKAGIDEATHLPTKYDRDTGLPGCPDYHLLLASLRLSPDGNPQMFLTGNPGFSGDRWVKHRFIKVKVKGEVIPPRTPFRDPVSGHLRIFINATVFDNPWILQNDPGYVKTLLELPPQKQQAWIYGNWDAFEGQYFDFNPALHVIDPEEARPALPPYVYRWLSCDWGYSHPAAVHAFAQGIDGRIHVYRELSFAGKVGAYEMGVEIGKSFFEDLQNLPDNHLTMYISHDAFQKDDNVRRRVDWIQAGIQTVLGPASCFILELNEDEKTEAMKDPDSAVRKMNQRRVQATRDYGITIAKAPKNSVDNWNYFRELLRTEEIAVDAVPDATVVQRLRQQPNSEALVANYLHAFERKQEVLPGLLIHSCCKRVIETLPEMTFDENDPEKMKKVDGDDWVDSLMYGLAAHRAQQNRMPLAYYVADQVREAFAGREVDMAMAHLMNMQAKEKYDRTMGGDEPMRLGRFAGRGLLGV